MACSEGGVKENVLRELFTTAQLKKAGRIGKISKAKHIENLAIPIILAVRMGAITGLQGRLSFSKGPGDSRECGQEHTVL